MSNTKEIQVLEQNQLSEAIRQPLTLNAVNIVEKVKLIDEVMNAVMKKDVHYGTIPGCGNKPTLLKPGAEKLLLTFRLAPDYKINVKDFEGGHREYEIVTTLTHMVTGQVFGSGVGSCSTMESKYKYRTAWANKVKTKVENDDLASIYNTVLKMAKKRSLVDAVLTVTGASDIFTQDIEDIKENLDAYENKSDKTEQTTEEYFMGEDIGEYVMDFGKFNKGKKLKDIEDKSIRQSIEWCEKNNAKADFVKIAKLYLGQKEFKNSYNDNAGDINKEPIKSYENKHGE